MIPGVIAAVVAIVVVSRLGAPPSAAVQATHDEVQGRLQAEGY
jgi:sodium/proline symporter